MTRLQERERALFLVFQDICRELRINYYMVCGSTLGAVKYHGFIPWDDDLDVGLLRADYEIFCEKAGALLPEGLFLQNYRTDPAFPLVITKIRDSRTTFVETQFSHLPMNHGVYIDVFPLDGYPAGRAEQRWFEVRKFCFNKLRVFAYRYGWQTFRLQRILRWYDLLLSTYPVENSALICNFGNWQKKLEYAPREQYGPGTMGTFEGIPVRLPQNYDAYLTQKYGNYRADLPPEKQNSGHRVAICDPNRPYTDYIVKLENGKIRLKKPDELQDD